MRRRFPYILVGAGVCLHLLFLVSLRLEWLNPLFNDAMHRFGPGCDFFSIYAAGIKARLGESVYTIGGHVEQVPYAYAFRYAPLVAQTLGEALSFLDGIRAYALWLILCELALLRNIRLTWEMAPDRQTGLTACALWLLFSPYYLELYVGQFTFITASLVFWAYVGWKERGERREEKGAAARRGIAGAEAAFAAGILLKMFPLLYIPVAMVRRRWVGLVGAVVALVWTSWAYFTHFPGDWAVFTDTNAVSTPTWHAGNQGLMALLYALSGENADLYLLWRKVALVLIAGALLWLWVRAWRQRHGAEGEACLLRLYAALSATYLLCYKDVWEHHYVIILPALVLLCLRRERAAVWLPAFVVAAVPGLFRLYDIPLLGYNEDPQRYWRSGISLLHHGWKPIAALWLFGGVLASDLASTELGERWRRLTAGLLAGRRRLWAVGGASACCVGLLVGGGRWAASAMADQRSYSRELAWPSSVFQRQVRRENCGPAALAAVCRHYGIAATEDEMARLAGTTTDGTSMQGLQEAALAKGLSTRAVRTTPEGLARLPQPSILFYHEGHFAVVTGVENGRFYLADPSLGERVWDKQTLMQYWSGVALLLGPAER